MNTQAILTKLLTDHPMYLRAQIGMALEHFTLPTLNAWWGCTNPMADYELELDYEKLGASSDSYPRFISAANSLLQFLKAKASTPEGRSTVETLLIIMHLWIITKSDPKLSEPFEAVVHLLASGGRNEDIIHAIREKGSGLADAVLATWEGTSDDPEFFEAISVAKDSPLFRELSSFSAV